MRDIVSISKTKPNDVEQSAIPDSSKPPSERSRKLIPLNKPFLGHQEREAVLHTLESGNIGGNGPIGCTLEQQIQERFGVRRVLLTTSCTHALEMAAMVLNLGPGDEVIMPSFGYVTAATCIVRQGAQPIFAEIESTTFNLDPEDVRRRITPNTRAILCIHYAGQACDMDAMMDLAKENGLFVIEDAAQAIGARFNGRFLGTIGHIGVLSFHVTKNVMCGEGGAFLTNDASIANKAEIIREKGTDRSKFLRGEVDKYTWVDEGSSYVLSDLLASVALAQFAKMEEIQERRKRIWWRYQQGLADLADDGHIALPFIDARADPNWHIYAFTVTDLSRRDAILARLSNLGIRAAFHFIPLHSAPYSKSRWGYRPQDLPITERVGASLIRLPMYPELSRRDQAYVIDCVNRTIANQRRRKRVGD